MDALIAVARSGRMSAAEFLLLLGAAGLCWIGLPLFASWRVRKTIPTAANWNNSKIYRSWISSFAGTIHHEAGNITWRFDPVRFPKRKDFIVYAPDDEEVLRIRRCCHFPPRFEVVASGQVIGVIRPESILLNKYTLELRDGAKWTFIMPLYTVHFRAKSTAGDFLWIHMGPSKRQWNVLVPPDFDNVQVLSAMAFIHRRWYL